MSEEKVVRIAGAAGAWGDSSLSTPQLISDGRSDYVIYEGLAEITMAILSRAKRADPSLGYARDLIETIAANVSRYRESGIKVITNAGGVNPKAAAELIRATDPSARVAVIEGDDLSETDFMPEGAMSANAYLGAWPIAEALGLGAEIVVTGRVVDSALALGPLIHEFGWARSDLDLLSVGSLAGHLIECGPQSTGGLLTDWEDTASWSNPGYPIVEVSQGGSMVLTAAGGSNAVVDERTVTEQILYEIGNPAAYLLPDVTCDWSAVTVEDLGDNRVEVRGARGRTPPQFYKGCAQVQDGWRAMSLLYIGGIDAARKAHRAGHDILERGREMLTEAGAGDFAQASVEVIGSDDEVMLKVAVHHADREAVARFVREVPSLGLAGPPGVTGGGAGLPRPTPLIRLECFGVPRSVLSPTVIFEGQEIEVPITASAGPDSPLEPAVSEIEQFAGETQRVRLVEVAHGRSGDKGSDVNVGIRARRSELWPVLRRELTVDRVGAHLKGLGATEVQRYELPGIRALNFLLVGGLGEGGTASLRMDPQGKTVAQQLLAMEIEVPVDLI